MPTKSNRGFAPIFILIIVIGLVIVIFGPSLIKLWPLSKENLPPELELLKQKATGFMIFSLGTDNSARVITGDFTGYENKKDVYEIAISFFEDYKNLYHLTNPREELKLENKETGNNGTKLVFSQIYQKVPVFGAEAIVWITKDNKINSVSSSLVGITNLNIKPKTSETDARKDSKLENPGKVVLYVYAPQTSNQDESPQLAWLVEGETENIFVNAENGKIITAYATRYQAINRLTYDALEQPQNPGIPLINEKGNGPNLPPGKPDTEAKMVHKDIKTSYDYFYAKFDRDGWNNKGMDITTSVHYRDNPKDAFNNSFWSPGEKRVAFGTGFGSSIDVTGHEYVHAVESYTSNLIYQAQSGAMNESFADIFGTFIQFYSGTYNWTIGEGNITTWRDMKNPTSFNQPTSLYDKSKYQKKSDICLSGNDYCGVHQNSSLINKVAQLLVEGGINDGAIILPLGLEKTEQLLYFVMTQKLTKSSQFMDARTLTIHAAKNGFVGGGGFKYTFSNKEVGSIMNAFASVGIGPRDSDFDTISNDDENGGLWLSILDVKTQPDEVYPIDCLGNKEANVYVFTANGGFYQTEEKRIEYSYIGENKVYTGEYIDLGEYDQGGEFAKGNWYHFKLNNFPKSGTIKYKVTLKGPYKVYQQSPEVETKISVCNQKTLSPTDTVPTIKPIVVPTVTPTPTPASATNEQRIVITSESRLDGYVSSSGRVADSPEAGESSSGARAFLSFDFSQIPSSSQILSATLSTNGAVANGDPFSLGNLTLIDYDFDTLDSSDYDGRGNTIGTMTSLSTNSFNVIDNVRNKLGGNRRLQVKLQFDNSVSENRITDYLEFPSSRMELIIVYR